MEIYIKGSSIEDSLRVKEALIKAGIRVRIKAVVTPEIRNEILTFCPASLSIGDVIKTEAVTTFRGIELLEPVFLTTTKC